MKSNSSSWRWFLSLAALEAGAAFVALAATPHETSGYSTARLAVLILLGVLLAVCGYFAIRVPGKLDGLAQPRYAFLSLLISLLLALALLLLRYLEPERLLPYYQRLSPLLWYLLVLSAEFSFWCLLIRYGLHPEEIRDQRPVWRASLLALALLLGVFVFIAITRVGLTPDSAYWGEPGVPVLGWQFALALLCGAAMFFMGLEARGSRLALDLVLAVCIWLLAAGIWLSVPTSVMKNSFYAPIDPPANQPFPNSDAGYYDSMAESLLIGYPYQGVIPTRPLYILLLTVLHLVVGERYDLIIAGQTLLLALIPVVLYFLGKRLHSRTAGIIVALFADLPRMEFAADLLSNEGLEYEDLAGRPAHAASNAVGLPACPAVFAAQGSTECACWPAASSGCSCSCAPNPLLLLPIVGALMILAYGIRNPGWRMPLILLLLGVIATLAPWLVHNYIQAGQLTLDAPFQYQIIASQYKYTGNLDINAIDLKGKSLLGILLAFAVRDPKFVAGFHCDTLLCDN